MEKYKCVCGETRPDNNATKFIDGLLVPAHMQPIKCSCGKLWKGTPCQN